MRATILCGALLPLALAAATARADFNAALADYKAGHHDSARRQFTAMGELGDCSSQYNLGMMMLAGQGGAKDVGTGIGWLEAATSNGCQELVGSRVTALQGALSPEEERRAADIMSRYGHDALHVLGIVEPELSCRGRVPAAARQSPAPEYPATGNHRDGLVVGQLTIGVDGHARDPQILLAVPDEAFAAAAVDAWLHSRFAPATLEDGPVESRLQVRVVFTTTGAVELWNTTTYKEARAAAEAGDPAAGYLVGLAATADSSLGMGAVRGTQLVIVAARDGYPPAQYWLGMQLRALRECHPQTDGSAWLRHAAAGGDAGAQLMLATDLASAGATDAQLREARTLLGQAASSDDYYVRKHVAALLAASPQAALRDPAKAREVAARLPAGGFPADPQMFEVLAAAAAANGDFAGAVSQQELALRKAHDLSWHTRAMEERLAAYKGGKAWQGELLAP